MWNSEENGPFSGLGVAGAATCSCICCNIRVELNGQSRISGRLTCRSFPSKLVFVLVVLTKEFKFCNIYATISHKSIKSFGMVML